MQAVISIKYYIADDNDGSTERSERCVAIMQQFRDAYMAVVRNNPLTVFKFDGVAYKESGVVARQGTEDIE